MVTVGMVRGWYKLDGPDAKSKAAELIKQEKYIFPSSNVSPFFVSLSLPGMLSIIIL